MRLFRRERPSILDEPINRVLADMATYGPEAEEYPALVASLERLIQLKSEESHKSRISPDTLAIVAGNLLGILVIVGYEHSHVMVSKASAFVIRPKGS